MKKLTLSLIFCLSLTGCVHAGYVSTTDLNNAINGVIANFTGPTNGITKAVATNIVVALAAPMPQVINTNFIDGQLYTNSYGVPIQVRADVNLVTSSFTGSFSPEEDLRIPGSITNSVRSANFYSPFSYITQVPLTGFIPSGSTYVFTNVVVEGNTTLIGGQIFIP